MKKGFSLIELLISLIVISVILASFAPIMTKKLKHGNISLGSSKKLTMTCPATVGSECTLCLSDQCIACPITCGNKFKNILTCKCEECNISNCINCSSSGANSCDICADGYEKVENSCIACAAGYYSTGGKTCQKCPKGSKANSNSAATSCISCSSNQYQDLEGQTSCKTCDTNKKPNSNHTDCVNACQTTSDCKDNEYLKDNCKCTNCPMHELALSTRTGCYDPCSSFDAKFVYGKIDNIEYKYCMKAYNAGDARGPTIPDLSNSALMDCLKVKDPWATTGYTVGYCTSASDMTYLLSDKAYDPCNRTVCTWYAADAICKGIGWKLPTINHVKALGQYYYQEAGGNIYYNHEAQYVALNLCYEGVNYFPVKKIAYCAKHYKSSGDTRAPASFWESEQGSYTNSRYYGTVKLSGEHIDLTSWYATITDIHRYYYNSVRCILDI